jgi:hypothetical protein
LKILIAIYVFAYLSSGTAYIFPNLLSIEKKMVNTPNIGAGYLRTGIRYFECAISICTQQKK